MAAKWDCVSVDLKVEYFVEKLVDLLDGMLAKGGA